MQVYPESKIQDDLFWGRTSSGLFSIKSALEILDGDKQDTDTGKWKQIWKIEATQKTKVFIWLLLHQAVLINKSRVKRGFASNPNSLICPNRLEDINHILRNCVRASEVWHYFDQAEQGIHDSNMGLQEWIYRNINHTTHEPLWPTKFAVIIWWLWRWRNEHSFGRTPSIAVDKIRYLFIKLEETIKALSMVEKWLRSPNRADRKS